MGHSLLPEVFQNYWPSCAQKNFRILDESLKKNLKTLKILHWNSVVSSDLFFLTWLNCQTTGGNWNPTDIPARAQEGRKRPLTSSSAHAEVTKEPEQGSPHQLHYHCQRISSQHFPGQQEHSATGILLWKLETQESVWGQQLPRHLRGAGGPKPHFCGAQGRAARPSAQPNPQSAPNICCWQLREPLHLFLWWQHKEDTATHNFHPSTLLLASSSPRSQ